MNWPFVAQLVSTNVIPISTPMSGSLGLSQALKTVTVFYFPNFKDEEDLTVILSFTDLKTIDVQVPFQKVL